jgi:hypothetical protein
MALLRLAGWCDACLPALFGVWYTAPAWSSVASEDVDSSWGERVRSPCRGFLQGPSHSAQPLGSYGREFLDTLLAIVGQDAVVSLPDTCEAA